MFPLRDDNPTFLTPVVTLLIIAANLAAWILVQGMGSTDVLARSICELGLIPGELLQRAAPGSGFQLTATTVCRLGDDPAWTTLISSMFLHGGWLHLLGNLWFLWVFGNNIEDSMGHLRFAAFYLLSGLAAAGVQILADPASSVPMVGASGAIGGVMGAYLVLYPRVRVHIFVLLGFYATRIVLPAMTMLGYWFVVQMAGGATSVSGKGGTAFWAHVGGFLAGMLLTPLFRQRQLVARHPYHGWSPERR